MTTSPYDNLPVGKTEENPSDVPLHELQEFPQESPQTLKYVDVPIEDPEASETAKASNPQSPMQQMQASESPKAPNPPDPFSPEPLSPEPPMFSPPPTLQSHNQQPAPQPFVKTVPLHKTPQYNRRAINNLWGIRTYDLPFEESLLVPDTMPDMAEALFAEGKAALDRSASTSCEKGAFISGNITTYTVYRPVSADSPVDVVKSTIPFKTDKCWEQAEGDSFRVRVSIKQLSIEMVNERKFTVTGTLSIQMTEIARKELAVYTGTDDKDLIVSQGAIQASALCFEAEETTEISQDINIREGQPAPVKVLNQSIDIIETHKQITSGKLVINATIRSQILYIGEEDGTRTTACLSNKTDFTQFIPLNEPVDASMLRVSFGGDDLKVNIENQNQFLLQGSVTTLIQAYENKTLPIASDAYHKTAELRFDINAQPLSCVKGTVCGEISAREVFDQSPDHKPQTLLYGSCGMATVKGRPERGRVIIEGLLPITLLALDENDTAFLIRHELPLRGTLDLPATAQASQVFVSPALKDFWFDEINSRQLEINASLSVEAWCFGVEKFHTLENFGIIEGATPAKPPAIALYVVGRNDTLWDIAKRYKCEMSSLTELNQLDPQRPLPEGMKLLVTG